jgi:hypothetical protein
MRKFIISTLAGLIGVATLLGVAAAIGWLSSTLVLASA